MKVSEPFTIFPRKLKSGKTVYYYQFRTDDGKRSTAKSTGCTTEASAKRFCNKLYNNGEFSKHSSERFETYAKDFFSKSGEWYKWKQVNNANITEETIDAYNKWLRNQIIPYFADYKLSAITRATVKNWIIWASEQWSPKTVNNAQTVLNTILNSAVDREIIDFNPANNIGFRKVQKIERNLLTVEELKAIYNHSDWLSEELRTAFLLDCITGMRISEIASLRKSDIYEDYIIVSHSYSRKHGLGETTKGKYSRIVPIPSDFKFPDSDNWIFQHHKDSSRPFDICRMYDHIIRICNKIGIDTKSRKISTHTLRDFYNTYLESENITDAKIKAVIGHKDVTMTGTYTHWKPDMFPEIHKAQDKLYKQITGVNNG